MDKFETFILVALALFALLQSITVLFLSTKNTTNRNLSSMIFTWLFYSPQLILPIVVLWGVFFG